MISILEKIMQILNMPLLLFIALLFTRFQVIFSEEKRRSSFWAIIIIAVLIALCYGSFPGGIVSYFLILELLVLVVKGLFFLIS